MAYHGYLNLEGGNSMIEFILKQVAEDSAADVYLFDYPYVKLLKINK